MINRRQFMSLAALAVAPFPALADVIIEASGELAGQATVLGRLPTDLNGVFYRNGPGRFELGGERYQHWFDGDGFAQRWQIAGGKVSHAGRFVATHKSEDESKAGRFLYPAFGSYYGRKAFKNNDSINTANTNLLPFNGGVYALWEGGSATELDPQTLATRGIKTWRSDLKAMPFSAHPKMDPDGGLWNFGTAPGADKLVIYRLTAKGDVARTAIIPLPQLNLVHDFVVSGRHLVFLLAPYDFESGPERSLRDSLQWAGQRRPMRAVVVAKDTLAVRQIFELPARSVFHFGNAYDDGGCTRFDAVLYEGDALLKTTLDSRQALRKPADQPGSTVQITLDYASGQARESRLFGASEFPRVAPQVVSSRHRKLLVLGAGGHDLTLDSVNMIDTDSGKADSYAFGAGWQVEEHVLVPRRGARSETDGYVVGVAQDTHRGQTVLTVFDAHNIKAGPMALARLPYRAPVCFHGNFLAT